MLTAALIHIKPPKYDEVQSFRNIPNRGRPFFTLWWPSQGNTDIFIEMPIRGYSRIEDVRELQTKQFTSDLHRLSDSKRVVRRATHSMNTVESLKKVINVNFIKWDASSRSSFRLNSTWGSIDWTTTGKTHLTLRNFVTKSCLRRKRFLETSSLF